MTTKNFNVKNGLTTGNIILDAATGNITATNANLGNLVIANYFVSHFQQIFLPILLNLTSHQILTCT